MVGTSSRCHDIAKPAHHQGIAVRRGGCRCLGADQRSGAGTILDKESLTDLLAQLVGQQAAAGRQAVLPELTGPGVDVLAERLSTA